MQEETTCTLAYGIYKLYALVRLHVNLPKCYMVGDVGQAMQAGGKVPCLAHKLVKEIIGITIDKNCHLVWIKISGFSSLCT